MCIRDRYYTRNSYDVAYAYTGTVPTGASALPEKATVKYGAPVTVAEAATAPGYTFSGWSRNDFTMPAENVTITGSRPTATPNTRCGTTSRTFWTMRTMPTRPCSAKR